MTSTPILVDIVGAIAGLLTTASFLPQAIKTVRTRQTRDISLTMWVLFCAGVALWIVYGVMIPAWPVIVANVPTLILAGIILWVKIGNDRRKSRLRHDEAGCSEDIHNAPPCLERETVRDDKG